MLERQELCEVVQDAIASLAPDYRMVIILREIDASRQAGRLCFKLRMFSVRAGDGDISSHENHFSHFHSQRGAEPRWFAGFSRHAKPGAAVRVESNALMHRPSLVAEGSS